MKLENNEILNYTFDGKDYFFSPTSLSFGLKSDYSDEQTNAICNCEHNYNKYISNKNIMNSDCYIPMTPMQKSASFSLLPINSCNMNCSYCFAGMKRRNKAQLKMKTETVYDIIGFAKNYYKECSSYRLEFVSGGEPLLAYDIVKMAISQLKQLAEYENKHTSIFLVTNATLLTYDIIKFFDDNNVNIGISLDGNRETHDKCRIDINGVGTYDKVIDALDLVRNSNLKRHTQDIWALSVIDQDTSSILDILRHYIELGITRAQVKVARETKMDNRTAYVKKIIGLYDDLFRLWTSLLENNDTSMISLVLNETDTLGRIMVKLLLKSITLSRCSAGKNKISIDENGYIFPCDSFASIETFCFGNVKDYKINKDVRKKFLEASIFSSDKCRNCWIRFVCGGDCYYNAYINNKDINRPDNTICAINQHIVKLVISLLTLMEKEYPHLLSRLKRIAEMKLLLRMD